MYSNNHHNFSTLKEEHKELLPGLTPPYQDELLSSWLYRLAQRHNIKVHELTKYLFNEVSFWTRDIDVNTNDIFLEILSKKTASSISQVKQTLLTSYLGILSNENSNNMRKWILLLNKKHRLHLNKSLMFCPSCLAKDKNKPFFRKQWRLSISICCTKCKALLLDCCPKCKKPIIFFRNHIGKNINIDENITTCYNCKFDISKSPVQRPTCQVLRVQRIINDILENGYNKMYPFLYFNALSLVVKTIISQRKKTKSIYNKLYKKFNLLINTNRTSKFEYLDIDSRRNTLFYAVWLLENWDKRFVKFFKSVKVYSHLLIMDNYNKNNIPFWYWDTIYWNFYIK